MKHLLKESVSSCEDTEIQKVKDTLLPSQSMVKEFDYIDKRRDT